MATFTVSRLDYEEDAGYVVQSTDAVQVAVGSPGPTGPTGATGPNNISGSTTTSLSGFLTGSSGVVKVTNLSSGLSLLYDSNTDSFLLGNSDRGSVAVTSHLAASDPHPQYTTETELTTALSGYALTSAVPGLAPVQSVAGRTGVVTIAAADVTDSTATGRAVLTAVSQAAARTAIGAGVGDAVTSGTLGQFAATTSAQLAGVLSDETGSGAAVFGTSPTLTTPTVSGTLTVRQSGGVAGTNEATHVHDATHYLITNKVSATTAAQLKLRGDAVRVDVTRASDGAIAGYLYASRLAAVGTDTTDKVYVNETGLRMTSAAAVGWNSTNNNPVAAFDIALSRDSASVLRVSDGSTGVGSLIAGNLTVRQSGGVAGTDEATHVHNGSKYTITNLDSGGLSHIQLVLAGGEYVEVSRSSGFTIGPIGTARYLFQDSTLLMASGVNIGWSGFTVPTSGYNDTGLARNAAGVVEINNGTAGTYRDLILRNLTASAGTITLGVFTVATLPSAASNASAFATVTDANSTTNGTTVAGGGSNRVPVFSNGTNWIIK